MLAKRKISFPSEANLLKAIKFTEIVEALDNNYDNIHKIPEKDKEIFEDLLKHIVDRKYIRVKIDSLNEDDETPQIIKSINYPGKSELNSSIKKYIRKEKRKLDKIGQMYTLFDRNSQNRLLLIDKIYKQFSSKVSDQLDKDIDLKQLISILIDGYNN